MRTASLIRLTGTTAGTIAAAHTIFDGFAGVMLAITLFALLTFVGMVLAEAVLPKPSPGRPRAASLQPRQASDYVPPPANALLRNMSIVLAVLVVLTSGLSMMLTPVEGLYATYRWNSGQAHAPWPTFWFGMSVALVLGASFTVRWLVVRRLVLRPMVDADDPQRTVEEDYRRRVGQALTSFCGTLAGASLTMLLFLAARFFLDAFAPVSWPTALGHLLGASAIVALLLTARFMSALIWPADQQRLTS